MKNNFIKFFFLFILLFVLTGCTTILKTSDNKIVRYDADTICEVYKSECSKLSEELKNYTEDSEEYKKLSEELNTCNQNAETKCENANSEATGQNITKNILCLPNNNDILKIYSYYNVDLSNTPSCTNFSFLNNYESLWINIFVKPLAWILLKVGYLFNNFGISLLVVTLLIRLCLLPFTKKTAMQSENIKKAQPEIDRINKKYENKVDQVSQTQKAQETMMVYKKYDINPLSSCLFAFIQIPLLFAFIEAINRTPALFEGNFLGFNLGLTPWQALITGKWWYLIIVAILALITYYSLKMNKTAGAPGADTEKQMEMMNKFMLVFIVYASFSMSTAICIYWITSSAFTVFQNYIVKRKV